MESNRIDRETAAAQLAALRDDSRALAERVVQPWWYDVVLGFLLFVVLVPALVLAEGFDQRWAMVVAGAVLGVAVGVLSRRWGRAYAAELRAGNA